MKKQIGNSLWSLLMVFVLMVVMCLGVPTVFADGGGSIAEDEIVIDGEENEDVDAIEDLDEDVYEDVDAIEDLGEDVYEDIDAIEDLGEDVYEDVDEDIDAIEDLDEDVYEDESVYEDVYEDENEDVDLEEIDIYGGASKWAVEEIKKAAEYNLLSEKVIGNYTNYITKEEFCELAVRLYEELSGKTAELPEVNPFVDTENPEVLKANLLGIVLDGIVLDGNETEFAPNDLVTREQIATMFYRTIQVADPYLIDGQYEVTFEDKEEITESSREAVGFMNNKGILTGVGNNEVDPKGNATREQGIALVKRVFETFKQNNNNIF
ncbi:MAG: S-layer homology domain-containing protein [Dehalobacterium sp.]